MYLSVSMCVQVFRNLKLIRFYIAAFIMTTLSHPFKDEIELPDLSEDEQKLVDELFAWYIRLCSKLTINLYTLRFIHIHTGTWNNRNFLVSREPMPVSFSMLACGI